MTTNTKFETLPARAVEAPEPDAGAVVHAARGIGPGLATSTDVAVYLGVSPRTVPDVLARKKVTRNRAGRVSWSVLWRDLWLIPDVPPQHFIRMQAPLLTVTEVATRIGVSARSVLRDGDRKDPLYELPRHIQLSPRIRRYHPWMIFLWEIGEPIEDWMRPIRPKPHHRRGLRANHAAPMSAPKPP